MHDMHITMDWQLILTAPRDGTKVLLYTPAAGLPGRQCAMEGVPCIQSGYWRTEYGASWWQTDLSSWDAGEWGGAAPAEICPTYWAPMPKLPTSARSIQE